MPCGPDHGSKVRFAGCTDIETAQHLRIRHVRIVGAIEHIFRLVEGEERIRVSTKGDSVDRPEGVKHDEVERCSAGLALEFVVQATRRNGRIDQRFLDKRYHESLSMLSPSEYINGILV